jgi:para-nitrobenzyl esterase
MGDSVLTERDDDYVVVATSGGMLRGQREAGNAVFRGIRYAEPPVGPLRFRAPKPVEAWDGVRDALRFAPICPQIQNESLMARKAQPQSEDCLALNIWSPATDGGSRPVMVWIHGGGFSAGSGSSPLYSGETFAAKEIVYVSLNYRLHVLGFLDLDGMAPGFETSANNGVADLVAGLGWIRENIAAFGGDPDNVTIFGESAGGALVGVLMATPSAKGLFHRAICQSSTGHHTRSKAVAARATEHFCKSVGLAPNDIAALQALPIDRLVEAVRPYEVFASPEGYGEIFQGSDLLGEVPFRATAGDSVIPIRVMETISRGEAAKVDLIVGSNEDEFRLFYVADGGRPPKALTERSIKTHTERLGVTADELKSSYAVDGLLSDGDLHIALSSDLWFILPGRELAQVQSRFNPKTYRYNFSWKSPAFGGLLGAAHGLDIPFVFDQLSEMSELTGNNPPSSLAHAMHDAWIAFARTGDPGWPAWSNDHRMVMRFDETSSVVEDPDGKRATVWKPVYPELG